MSLPGPSPFRAAQSSISSQRTEGSNGKLSGWGGGKAQQAPSSSRLSSFGDSNMTKYRNPHSRLRLDTSSSSYRNTGHGGKVSRYSPPSPLTEDPKRQWNEGDIVPKGGPLPLDRQTRKPQQALREYGGGVARDPKVLFIDRYITIMERRDPNTLKAYIHFSQQMAERLRFTHFWIRKGSHAVETDRDMTTGLKTGDVKPSQNHMTVFLGQSSDWVNISGHIFVLAYKTRNPRFELMPEEQMWEDPKTSRKRRVIEMWKWDEDGCLKSQQRHEELVSMGAGGWRR
ncbi:hypothetical protein F5Y15DRAFT_424386 [Xylariaceae sp. FL0016]|nr:hypothetical protein F5Y15DRAFT_424386 [Xylariaceae sp. FL0016]